MTNRPSRNPPVSPRRADPQDVQAFAESLQAPPHGSAASAAGSAILRRVSDSPCFIINTDGACKGNPGPASIGAVIGIEDPDGDPVPVEEISEYIGEATNNVAEYTAVIRALERAVELGARHVVLRTDSELLTKQLTATKDNAL